MFTTEEKVTSSIDRIDAAMEFGDLKLGLEKETSQITAVNGVPVTESPETEFLPGLEGGDVKDSGDQIGVGAGACIFACGEVEVGVQGDKVLNDLENNMYDAGAVVAIVNYYLKVLQ